MKRLFQRLLLVGVPSVLVFGGCGGGGGGSTAPPTTVTLRGKVQSDEATPAPIAGARVVLGGKTTTTDADGNYEFTSVKVTARQTTVTIAQTVSKDQFGTVLNDDVEVTMGQTKTLDPVNLPLRPNTGSISGKVVRSTDGAAIVNALVTIGTGDGAQQGRTDDNGVFELSGLFTGQQPYRAERTGFLTDTGVVDNVVQGQTTALAQNIRLVPSSSDATVKGTVRDEDGNAIQGATVTVGSKTADTDANGRYELANVPVGTRTFTAAKDGFNDSQRQIDLTGEQGEIDFVLFSSNEQAPDLPYNIAGTVVDGSSTPLSGATVTALKQSDRSEVARSRKTGVDGKFYLFVPAGSYILRAEKAGAQPTEQSVTLPGGGQIVTGRTLTLN